MSRACFTAAAVLALAGAGCGAEADPNPRPGVNPFGSAGAPGGVNNPVNNPVGGPMNTAGSASVPPITSGGAGMGSVGVPNQGGTAMPCEVNNVVKSGCQGCHGASPIGGAPMPLMALTDFQAMYTVKSTPQLIGKTMKMYELARIRLNREQGTSPMPQGSPLSTEGFASLDGWLRAGAPSGTACTTENPGAVAGAGGTVFPMGENSQCDLAGAFEPLVAQDGETCYEFTTHGRSGATDTSKFNIPLGESYSQFYFDIPWSAGVVASRFGSRFDNLKVLHHWLAFSSTSGNANGTVTPNVSGTTLGENTELIAGWAVGGCTTTYPPDVGVKLPTSGKIMVQWHHYNNTSTPQTDGSSVQICTVPEAQRKNIAGLTFLGTENFNGPFGMGPGKQDFTTACSNDSGAPITILGFTPHMHTIGSNMASTVIHANGMREEIFNKPFVFDQQVNYMLKDPYVLMPGDSIESTCTFQNDTGANVAFGQSTNQEMCYQFTLAYPHGALNNGVLSLIGATNTCW